LAAWVTTTTATTTTANVIGSYVSAIFSSVVTRCGTNGIFCDSSI
jgi:hypothetical protein